MAVIGNEHITVDSIYDVVAAHGGVIDEEASSLFSIHARLNMWSKYKPVPSETPFYSLEAWRSSGFTGSDGQCGLTIPSFSSVSAFVSAVDSGEDKWYYIPPQGGDKQPMRLDDFIGYCTEAENPIGHIITSGVRDYENNVSFGIDVAHGAGSTTNLSLSDISLNRVPLSSFYLGIYAYNDDGIFYMHTGADPIGSANDLQVLIPFADTGKFYYVPFLSSTPQTGRGNPATFIGLNFSPALVNVIDISDFRTVSVSAMWSKDFTSFTIEHLDFENNDAFDAVFSDITVFVYTTAHGADNGNEGTLVKEINISGSWTVPAKGKLSASIDIVVNIAKDDSLEYWIGATSNYNKDIVVWGQIQDDPNIMPELLARIMSLRNL